MSLPDEKADDVVAVVAGKGRFITTVHTKNEEMILFIAE